MSLNRRVLQAMTEQHDMASVRRRLSIPSVRLQNSIQTLEYEGLIQRVIVGAVGCAGCGGCGRGDTCRSGYIVTESGMAMLRSGTETR